MPVTPEGYSGEDLKLRDEISGYQIMMARIAVGELNSFPINVGNGHTRLITAVDVPEFSSVLRDSFADQYPDLFPQPDLQADTAA